MKTARTKKQMKQLLAAGMPVWFRGEQEKQAAIALESEGAGKITESTFVRHRRDSRKFVAWGRLQPVKRPARSKSASSVENTNNGNQSTRAKRITKGAVVERVLSKYQGEVFNLDVIDRAWSSLRDEDSAPVKIRGWRILGGPSEQWFEEVADMVAARIGQVDHIPVGALSLTQESPAQQQADWEDARSAWSA